MKYKIGLLLLTIICASCSKDDQNQESTSLAFFPRHCNNIYIIPGAIAKTNSGSYTKYRDSEQNGEINGDSLILSILTSSYDISNLYARGYPGLLYPTSLDQHVDNHNQNIETQITLLYKKTWSSTIPTKSDANSVLFMEYRLDGIRSLKISTLNTKLFGIEPGGSLNEFFKIIYYNPQIIISSTTQNLLYPGSIADLPTSIDEWLAISPMAQPAMYLELKSAPPELPQTVQFTVEMETDTGTKLSYTSFPVTLTK